MKSATIIVSLLAAAALSACAQARAPAAAQSAEGSTITSAPPRCFRMSQIRNHRIAENDTIYLKVGFRAYYKVTTVGSCAATAMPDETLIMSTASGSDLICRPIDLDLKIRHSADFISPCIVKDIVKLTPEQVAALPKKFKP